MLLEKSINLIVRGRVVKSAVATHRDRMAKVTANGVQSGGEVLKHCSPLPVTCGERMNVDTANLSHRNHSFTPMPKMHHP